MLLNICFSPVNMSLQGVRVGEEVSQSTTWKGKRKIVFTSLQ